MKISIKTSDVRAASNLRKAFAKFCSLVVGTLLFFHALTAQAQVLPLITVSKAVWTNKVVDRQYQHQYTENAPVAPIYIWFELRGGPAAIDALRKDHQMPVTVRWTWFVGAGGEGYAGQLIHEYTLTVGNTQVIQRLADQVQRVGFFTWRTWAIEKQAAHGVWQAELDYLDDTNGGAPVTCGTQACTFRISMKGNRNASQH